MGAQARRRAGGRGRDEGGGRLSGLGMRLWGALCSQSAYGISGGNGKVSCRPAGVGSSLRDRVPFPRSLNVVVVAIFNA